MAIDVKCRTEDASNNNVIALKGDLISKKPEVDLSFENLTYTVNTFNELKMGKKEILHGINGSFRSGQLTAIMGPSGCGKSTLLNVLAGYSISGSSGSVYLNGSLRDEKQMSDISCYIQQDDYVRDLLTVRESMTVAAHLKLSTTVSTLSKTRQVEDLLGALGLTVHADTVTKRLSGGQKKRLSIALELITNPSILFLDEPTTGLDSQSCSQFVSLMVDLAHNQNRTMVCTLHQPSALLFEKFDQVYALSSGRCIYQGPPNLVIPYFSEQNIVCPPYHNPADFLIEVAIGEYGTDVLERLFDASTQNSRNNSHYQCNINSNEEELQLKNNMCLKSNNTVEKLKLPLNTKPINKPPCYLQIYHLYLRNVIMYKRNKTSLSLRILVHFMIAVIFGYLYRGVGNNAEEMISNMVFVYGTNLFLVYTGQMAVIVSFPLEYKVLKREHFNGWFSLFPYMISILLVEVPFQILCCLVYIAPSYLMTSQPLELMRFSYFTIFLLVTSLTSQSTGFLFGCTLPVKVSVFIGPVFVVLLSVFGFAIRLTDIPPAYVWLHYTSFIRSSYQSLVYSLYGFDREDLPCYDPMYYCHYKVPAKFLAEMEFANVNVYPEFFYICFFFLCTYILTITVIWYRLNRR